MRPVPSCGIIDRCAVFCARSRIKGRAINTVAPVMQNAAEDMSSDVIPRR
jgi:hypothetical protein